jgi:ribosomal protein L36
MNHAYSLLRDIQRDVYSVQKKLKSRLKKNTIVRRNGVVYRIIGVRANVIEVSDTKTPANQISKFNLKSFLSKHIELLDKE